MPKDVDPGYCSNCWSYPCRPPKVDCNAIIEKCALAVQAKLEDHDPQLAEYAAEVIRALKD
jgi:hypothetical protein